MPGTSIIDPAVFEKCQQEVDQDIQVRDQLKSILKDVEQATRNASSALAAAHSSRSTEFSSIAESAEPAIEEQRQFVSSLGQVAQQYPFYRYNDIWSKALQNCVFVVLFAHWLKAGTLLSMDETAARLGVSTPPSDNKDIFHLTVDEYLHGAISLINELSRLAVNAVTMASTSSDQQSKESFQVPMQINQFVKGVQSGFLMLNLKNDSLRRRSDSIKYDVKKIEEVVYDLSLRGLASPVK